MGFDTLLEIAPNLPRWTMLYALVFARMGAMLMLLPGFSDDAVPGRLRLLIALAVAAGLQGMVGAHTGAALDTVMSDDAGFAHMLLVELLTGLLLGGVVRLMFLAITIAGAIISLNVGLTSALVNDPSAGGQVPILARFISVSALLVCMVIAALFLEALLDAPLRWLVGSLFLCATLALVVGLAYFLREVHLATTTIRIVGARRGG